MDDRDLIQRCRAGEREAQRQLFEETSPRIYRLLRRMTGNAEDAADLTQETYLRGLQRLDQFDGRSEIATWLYRIGVNVALQHRRRQATAGLRSQDRALLRGHESETTSTDLQLDLDEALAELPVEDRAVLLLRYQEGLDYQSISHILECAPGTVASRLHRARERLRQLLRRSYG